MLTHVTLTAHALPGSPWEPALTDALALARRVRQGVTLHWQDTVLTVLPGTTRADVARWEGRQAEGRACLDAEAQAQRAALGLTEQSPF